MSTDIDDAAPSPAAGERPDHPAAQPSGAYVLAALLGGAGVIHLVEAAAHVGGGSWVDPVAFAAAGWAQVAMALLMVAGRGSRALYGLSVVASAAFVGVWALSRTVGLPVGSHVGVVEPVGLADGTCVALQVAAVLVAVALLVAPDRLRLGVAFPSMAAVAVLALATLPLVAADGEGDTGGHSHGGGTDAAGHAAEMAAVDAVRCDRGFNPADYWSSAPEMGVDTYLGGAMAAHELAGGTSVLDRARAADAGDGSPGLDALVAATSNAGDGEVAAAGLVNALARADESDYQAWVRWMGRMAVAGTPAAHSHGDPAAGAGINAAAPDDSGHGGHAGPQPWVAMVDQGTCVQLAEQLEVARSTAAKFPTAADAEAGGWVKVTPYVPGIAAHYMNYSMVDGTFAVDEPEMLLYDGEGPSARIVGLSYYLVHDGEAEPTQGFAGPNDHFHRHQGLCTKAGAGVIGDSTTTAEECAAMGGVKSNGSKGWMSHAWVVPGCESPWGVFSGANPLLDQALSRASGQNGGGCSASSVRDRYDLRPGSPTGTGESASGGD